MDNTIQLYLDKEKQIKGYPITSPDRVVDENGVNIKDEIEEINSSLDNIAIYPHKIESETNYTNAFYRAINTIKEKGKGTIHLGQGKVYKGNIHINTENVTISGGGVLQGKIIIGEEVGEPKELNFNIDNVTIDNIDSCIELVNVRDGKIQNCTFKNGYKAIHVKPVNTTHQQHVNKIIIDKNKFYNNSYCLYADKHTEFTQVFTTGDIHFTNNQAYNTKITHIHLLGIDGIIISNNTLFFPGYQLKDINKKHNIYADYCTWVIINSNNLFESGEDGIVLRHFQNANITNNNIVWSGQSKISNAITLIDGDTANNIYNISSISSNNIIFPTKHGIEIGNIGQLNVDNNLIKFAGYEGYYYGVDNINSITHYAILNSSNNPVYIKNNVSIDNLNSFTDKTIHFNNVDTKNNINNKSTRVLTLNTLDGAIDSSYWDFINLAQPSPKTISNIVNGYDGKEITFFSYNSNTTIEFNDSIRLKDGINCNMPNLATLTLVFMGGRWFEKSRSF